MYRRVSLSTHRRIDVSAHQRVNGRCVDASIRRRVDASTCRHVDASTHQRIDASARRYIKTLLGAQPQKVTFKVQMTRNRCMRQRSFWSTAGEARYHTKIVTFSKKTHFRLFECDLNISHLGKLMKSWEFSQGLSSFSSFPWCCRKLSVQSGKTIVKLTFQLPVNCLLNLNPGIYGNWYAWGKSTNVPLEETNYKTCRFVLFIPRS